MYMQDGAAKSLAPRSWGGARSVIWQPLRCKEPNTFVLSSPSLHRRPGFGYYLALEGSGRVVPFDVARSRERRDPLASGT